LIAFICAVAVVGEGPEEPCPAVPSVAGKNWFWVAGPISWAFWKFSKNGGACCSLEWVGDHSKAEDWVSNGGFGSAVSFVAWRDWLRVATGNSLFIWSVRVSGMEEGVFDWWYEEPMLMLVMLLGMAGLDLLSLLLRLGQGVEARESL